MGGFFYGIDNDNSDGHQITSSLLFSILAVSQRGAGTADSHWNFGPDANGYTVGCSSQKPFMEVRFNCASASGSRLGA